MDQQTKIILFADKSIRNVWDAEQEEWFFSVVDVVAVLTDSANPTDYLKKLRKRDEQLGEYVGTNCPQVACSLLREKQEEYWPRPRSSCCELFSLSPQKSRAFQAMVGRGGQPTLRPTARP